MKDKKIVIVTGAAQGLGKSNCTTVAFKEDTLEMVYLQEDKLYDLREEILQTGCDAASYKLDLCDEAKIADFFRFIEKEHGRLDILINNAGVDVTKPITELSVGEWD